MEHATDERLMANVQLGDHAAFAELRERYNGQLIRLARARRINDVDEAAQDAWIRVWTQRDKYDPGRPFKAWLFTVADRHYLTLLKMAARREKRIATVDELPDVGNEPETIDRDEAARALALLNSLPEPQAEAIRLCVLDGKPGRKAAPALGISSQALGMRKRAGLAALRAMLGDAA